LHNGEELPFTASFACATFEQKLTNISEAKNGIEPGEKILAGPGAGPWLKARRRYFEEAFKKQPQRDLKLTSLRAERFDAMMYDSGEWSQTLPGPDGKP